eukprot:2113176-Amphidinium_carterae.1
MNLDWPDLMIAARELSREFAGERNDQRQHVKQCSNEWRDTWPTMAVLCNQTRFTHLGGRADASHAGCIRKLEVPLHINMDATAGISIGSRRRLGRVKHIDTVFLWCQEAS